MKRLVVRLFLAASLMVVSGSLANATPKCVDLGYGAVPGAKANKLYLYFPPSDDASYPDFHVDSHSATTPAHAFNIADLTSFTGTATALRDAIFDVVTDDYCEFNVEVLQTTSAPTGEFVTLECPNDFWTLGNDHSKRYDLQQICRHMVER
jgi:hypothetical protein